MAPEGFKYAVELNNLGWWFPWFWGDCNRS